MFKQKSCAMIKASMQVWEILFCDELIPEPHSEPIFVFSDERGKAGGHEPPLFPLPYHILAFFFSAAMSHEPKWYI